MEKKLKKYHAQDKIMLKTINIYSDKETMIVENSGFSHDKMAKYAIETKVRRAITMVTGDNPNKDIAIQHPEWIRAAQKKDYTELTKYVTEHCKKAQLRARQRRLRFAGKD